MNISHPMGQDPKVVCEASESGLQASLLPVAACFVLYLGNQDLNLEAVSSNVTLSSNFSSLYMHVDQVKSVLVVTLVSENLR